MKLFAYGILVLSAYAQGFLGESGLVGDVLQENIVGSFLKGFFEGLLKDPSTASTNPCLLQIKTTQENRNDMASAFVNIKSPHDLISFIPKLRLFADSYNQEIAVCNYPTLLTLSTTILKLDNLGEYFIKYIVKSNDYNQWYGDMIMYCQAGEYEACGLNAGKIFSSMTLFGI